MLWEPMFRQRSIVDETGFYSALDTPLKDGEDRSSFSFPPKQTSKKCGKSSPSSQTSPLQISPAPEDYYQLVPITPHQSRQASRRTSDSVPQSQSLETLESRDEDNRTSTPLPENEEARRATRGGRTRRKTFRRNRTVSGDTSKKLTSPRREKSPAKPPSRGKFAVTSPKPSERTSSQSSVSSDSSSSSSESARSWTETPETPADVREAPFLAPSVSRYSSIDTDEFRTPQALATPFFELMLSGRRQSDPSLLSRRGSGARVRRASSTGDVEKISEDEEE